MTYRLYIGSNNRTGKVEDKKAIGIIAKQFEGFTVLPMGLGYWQGKQEATLQVEIETADKKKLIGTVKTLLKALKQDAIGVLAIGKMDFIGV